MYFGSQPLLQVTEAALQSLLKVNWLGGLKPERTYQRDMELADLEARAYVFPALSTFERDHRRAISPTLTVGLVVAKRIDTMGNMDEADRWASEMLRMRDTLVETYIEGYDVIDWVHPSGEVFDLEYQRQGVLACIVEVTYKARN